ncbi:MAG: helix-turn-helix domain-containing protein [Planctomycetales bacterium]
MAKKQHPFAPDYAVAPGVTLKESLDEKGITQAELSTRTGLAEKTISQIINGVAPISHETAEKLELALGVPARFWNRRELTYREAITRKEELARFEADVKWLKEIPVTELVSRDAIEHTDVKAELVRRVLQFFGVSSVASWQETWLRPEVQFRSGQSQKSRPGYVAAWLRLGQLKAESFPLADFNAKDFQRKLLEIRSYSLMTKGWMALLSKTCAEAGVAVVVTKEIRNASVSGATYWVAKRPIIQLSLKYKKNDQFWFSFFHEAGHVLLHGRRQLFVENGIRSDTEEEREANRFAADLLIPPDCAIQLSSLTNKARIRAFAEKIGVHPGIVVGRLQRHDVLRPSQFNDLKKTYKWK